MVEVMKLQRQRKYIRAAGKSSALRWKTSGSFFSSSELFLFLDQTFLFLDLDCLTSLRSVRQLSDLGKEKILSRKRKFAFEFFHLRATSFQPHGTYIRWVRWFCSRILKPWSDFSGDKILSYFNVQERGAHP